MTEHLTLTLALTLVGALIGMVVRQRLATLTYRRDDEASHPSPGPRWWIPIATPAASGLLAWRFGVDRWPLLLPTLPLAWFGPWLSAIDLDVRRRADTIGEGRWGAALVGATELATPAGAPAANSLRAPA